MGRVGSLTNQGNVVFSQKKNLESDGKNWRVHCRDGTAKFLLPTGPVVCAHSITKATKYPLVILFGDGLALWCVFVMHHPTGVEKTVNKTLTLLWTCRAFFGPRDDECFYCEDCAFVSGSYP